MADAPTATADAPPAGAPAAGPVDPEKKARQVRGQGVKEGHVLDLRLVELESCGV
jgi:hypothetical protein